MGYTHYHTRKLDEIPPTIWQAFTVALRPLLALGERDGVLTDLEVTDDAVVFNGVGPLAHETFVVERVAERRSHLSGEHFAFCKTSAKPYDAYVVAALILLATLTKDDPCGFSWSSDGETDDHADGLAMTGFGERAVMASNRGGRRVS